MAKVLIGIPTYARGKDSLVPLLNAIDAFQCSTDLLFADNSENDEYFNYLQEQGHTVIKTDSTGSRANKIIQARNGIRTYFLQGDWDYLFFIDFLVEKNLKEAEKCLKTLRGVTPFLKVLGVFA